MHFHVGTSGYSYKEWKGHFYPEKLPAKKMLGFYAEQFSTVEINGTFHRFPSESTVQSWAAQVPFRSSSRWRGVCFPAAASRLSASTRPIAGAASCAR